tara:strand:+ start:357 stop:626 length:270 start_codon:yes stop_codon:yes gene_type:complete
MKIFFYKSILVFILFILAIHFSFSVIKKEIKNEYLDFVSKENVEHIKDKIRVELKNGIEKENLISSEDANLINNFLIKVKSELKKNNNK